MKGCAEILLVEDNEADRVLFIEGFRESKRIRNVSTVTDGVEALAFLRRESSYENSPLPSLVLLDLNLPRKNGHEVLLDMRRDPKLKRIPVIVITTSKAGTEIEKCYDLGVNSCITKPCDLDDFLGLAQRIEDY